MCNCRVCNKKFEYGDENSPMLKDDVWNDILKYYNIKEEESEKWELCCELWDAYQYSIKSKKAKNVIEKVLDSEYLHTYICVDCMEKALGRKLTKQDLIGENIPFNEDFEREYFK